MTQNDYENLMCCELDGASAVFMIVNDYEVCNPLEGSEYTDPDLYQEPSVNEGEQEEHLLR